MDQTPSTPSSYTAPENSQGHLADNPDIFYRWASGDNIEPSEWPYLMLCRDQENDSLTWHMFCRDSNIPSRIAMGLKAFVDKDVSMRRNRRLVGLELFCRHGEPHTFLI